jgi:hypothetical protein
VFGLLDLPDPPDGVIRCEVDIPHRGGDIGMPEEFTRLFSSSRRKQSTRGACGSSSNLSNSREGVYWPPGAIAGPRRRPPLVLFS